MPIFHNLPAATAARRAYVAALRGNPVDRIGAIHFEDWEIALCALRRIVAHHFHNGDEEAAQNWAEDTANFNPSYSTETNRGN